MPTIHGRHAAANGIPGRFHAVLANPKCRNCVKRPGDIAEESRGALIA
jgi:hypothetical protein